VVNTPPSNAGGAGLIPGQEAKIPYALWPKKQNIKQKQYCKKFNKDFKNGPHLKKKKKKKTPLKYKENCLAETFIQFPKFKMLKGSSDALLNHKGIMFLNVYLALR